MDHDGGDAVSEHRRDQPVRRLRQMGDRIEKAPEPEAHAFVERVRGLPVDRDGREPGHDENNSGPKQHKADCRVVARLSNPLRGLGPGQAPRLDFRHRYRTQSGPVPRRKTMDFDYSPKQKEWMARVGAFMDQHVYPAEDTYTAQMT